MKSFTVNPIGFVHFDQAGPLIQLEQVYAPGLQELDGFGHINVLWWCHECDSEEARNTLETMSPYKKAPEVMGIFATRSPMRPNPIALTASQVIGIDHEKGIVRLAYLDAADGTPVLDLKPYTPSIDRIEDPEVPSWCRHWPRSAETSGDFDWASEFNF